MKSIRCLLSIVLIIVLTQNATSQSGFRINLQLKGLNDSLILLASYNGDKQFVIDTIIPDSKYNYKLSADTLLPEGMYFFASSKKAKLLDFIIAGKQNVSITGDMSELPQSLTSKVNDQNKILFDYIKFLAAKQKEMGQLQMLRNSFAHGSDSAAVVLNRIQLLNEEVIQYINGIINANHGSFISIFLKSMQDPEYTPPPVLPTGKVDSVASFRAFKDHYWDNINLSDDRFIRTPLIHNKIEHFLQKMTLPVPDSLNAAIDKLFELSKMNRETFKYLIWYLTVKYESSDIMGHDAVFVHLVDKYYEKTDLMSWMNPTVKENLEKRANTLRPILIGKTAPELILWDTLREPVSLHEIKSKYTLIYFWDPECSHCKKETPLLVSFYNEYKEKYSLEVFGVCMDTSWKDMTSYIRKNQMNWINVNGFYSMTGDFREQYDVHSSPVMYLLDEKKTIIAKRILTEQMQAIINNREKLSSESQ